MIFEITIKKAKNKINNVEKKTAEKSEWCQWIESPVLFFPILALLTHISCKVTIWCLYCGSGISVSDGMTRDTQKQGVGQCSSTSGPWLDDFSSFPVENHDSWTISDIPDHGLSCDMFQQERNWKKVDAGLISSRWTHCIQDSDGKRILPNWNRNRGIRVWTDIALRRISHVTKHEEYPSSQNPLRIYGWSIDWLMILDTLSTSMKFYDTSIDNLRNDETPRISDLYSRMKF
jgi:hypothetical protein